MHSGGTIYSIEQQNWEDPEQESSLPVMQQSLLLFLFLQYSDPFTQQLPDIMGERQLHVESQNTALKFVFLKWCFCTCDPAAATEVLLEHHLEDILKNNRQEVTTALQTELKNTLRCYNRRRKASLS